MRGSVLTWFAIFLFVVGCGGGGSARDPGGDDDDGGPACVAACGSRVCGPDPVCGESCGTCDGPKLGCSEAGACEVVCELEAWTSNQTIALDLPVVEVFGDVTLDGKAFPAAIGKQRSRLGFRNTASGDTKWFDLPAAGTAQFALRLWRGTYDIVASSRTGDGTGIYGLAVNGDTYLDTVVERGVVFAANGRHDVALATTKLSGTVTLNGQAFPSATGNARSRLGFRNKSSGDTLWTELPATGPAVYAMTVWQGNYDVIVSSLVGDGTGVGTLIAGIGGLEVPDDLDAVIAANVAFTTPSVTRNLALETGLLSGVVSLNGKAFPEATGRQRSRLGFKNQSSGDTNWFDLPKLGLAQYQLTVWKGSYDVIVSSRPNDGTYVEGTEPYLNPYLDAPVAKDLAVTGPVVRDFALATTLVQGTLTLDGVPLPPATGPSRPAIGFRNQASGDTVWVSVEPTGNPSYSATLWQGTYDILVSSRLNDGTGVSTYIKGLGGLEVPDDLDGVLATGVALSGNVTRNLALATAVIAGEVTVNGAAFPPATGAQRSRLGFRSQASGDTKWFDLPPTGPAQYSLRLWKGNYDIVVSSRPGDGSSISGTVSGIDPNLDAVVEKDVMLAASATRNLGLEAFAIKGTVTLSGAAFPMATGATRSVLGFKNRSSGDAIWVAMPATGTANYYVVVWGGTYDIVGASRAGDGTQVSSPISSPTGSTNDDLDLVVQRGCGAATSDPGKDVNWTGTWNLLDNNGQPVTFNVVQSGTSLSGTGVFRGYSGSLTGTRSGGVFSIVVTIGGCPFPFTGTVDADRRVSGSLGDNCNGISTSINGQIQ